MADYWSDKVDAILEDLGGDRGAGAWRKADRKTIDEALTGKSPYSGKTRPDAGAHVAFNISSVHVPAFASRRDGRAYQNRYDTLGRRIGEATPHGALDAREAIDVLLGGKAGVAPESVYYGAVELNGSGIRYYGDVALILRPDRVANDALVLDRNSFDLILAPLRSRTHPTGGWDEDAAARVLDEIAGQWSANLVNMAICKVLGGGLNPERRITVGAISQGVLADEDYIEVIRTSSFDVTDLAEARLSAADAAVDGLVADRLRRGATPGWAELLWRHRRRRADQALRTARVATRVVVSAGRIRS